MEEILIKRLKENLGKEVTVFLDNGFRYYGKIVNVDEKYVEILDYKTNSYKVINISVIRDTEFPAGGENDS